MAMVSLSRALRDGRRVDERALGLDDELARRRPVSPHPALLRGDAHARRARGELLQLHVDRAVAGAGDELATAIVLDLVAPEREVHALEGGQRGALHLL